MAYATTDDGVRIYYEEHGSGDPLLFVHEFAGDHRSWEPQVAHFAERYRCIVYAARGYPPSEVPGELDSYSQERATDDAVAVLDELGIEQAHVVGLSMGGFATLHLALRYPDRVRSAVVSGVGYGAQPEVQEKFRRESEGIADAFRDEGAAKVAEWYSLGPARVQFQNKNPDGWAVFARQLAEHDSKGAAFTMRGVQSRRPSLYALRDELAACQVPILLLAGDEDEGCLEPDLMLKRTLPVAGLQLLPRTGHTCNLEEPELFNAAVERFLDTVEAGRWTARDPRSQTGSITGMDADDG